ncbi:prephenate dehydrogenase [Elusimicrobiota bacterium]
MKKITIVGVGLIGGSLGISLRNRRKKYHVVGFGRNRTKLIKAKKLGAVDEFTTNLGESVRESDVIVICSPVDLIPKIAKKILPYVKNGAIITDVGSVKRNIIKLVTKIVNKKKNGTCFIGAHPMAGSEKTGIGNAEKYLYKGATVVLIKNKRTPIKQLDTVKQMWQDAGAKTIFMDETIHDRVVASTSHLPHVIAYNLCLLVSSIKTKASLSKVLAGSFKDLTRVALSDPRSWSAICSENSKELKKTINIFIKTLEQVRNRLGKPRDIEKIFTRANLARQKLLNI